MSTLGLDIGTSGCKALVLDSDGRTLSEAHRAYALVHPRPGWAELDPSEVVSAAVAVLREAAAAARSDPVRALAISSQGEAFAPIAADGRVLCGAMVSSDSRATALARTWPLRFGEERLYTITGHTSHPLFSLFKLLWLREERPDIWMRSERFLCFEDLLHLHLGVEPAISWSLAGRTMLFDVREHAWSEPILAESGLDTRQLARPLPPGAVVGEIPGSRAADRGLPAGVVVVSGGHDQVCAALGAGAFEPGSAMYATGTVECIAATMEHAVFTTSLRAANLCTYDHAAPGRRATLAYSLTGGNLLAWFRDQWCRAEVEEARQTGENVYARILRDLPPGPSSLLVLPYFTPSGTPYFDAETPGAILGLRLETTREDVLRGLLEGVAYEMRLNLELMHESGIPVRTLRAVGGGARNEVWLQLKADVTGRPIERVEVTEAGCLGAALLARSALTGERVQDLADRWVRVSHRIEPDPARAAIYTQRFLNYRRLRPGLADLRLFPLPD
jgi:xylulokinase